MKRIFTLLLLGAFAMAAHAQTAGDYRSKSPGGAWTALSTWERFDGTNWVTPTAGEGYPGQNSGTGEVTITLGAPVDISTTFTTLPFGDMHVYDAVNMTASATLSTTDIFVYGPSGKLVWAANSVTLSIPSFSAVIFAPGYEGLAVTGPCNNTKKLAVGSAIYSCTGQGNSCLTFAGANAQGGTFRIESQVILVSGTGNTVCTTSFQLQAVLSGLGSGGTPTVSWTGSSASGTISFNPDNALLTLATVTAPGTYSITVSVTNAITDCGGQTVSDEETITVVVVPSASATVTGTTTVCVDDPSPWVTFNNTTSPLQAVTVYYNINGGPAQSVVITGASANVPAPTGTAGTFVYDLDSVKYNTSAACKADITGSATITVVNNSTMLAPHLGADTKTIAGTTIFKDDNCRLIAQVTPNGGSPVAGVVDAKVWVETTVQYYQTQEYVPRHYEIAPQAGSSYSGRITLYFLQSEFTAFNNTPNTGAELPLNGADVENKKANLRVYLFEGTTNDANSGRPETYPPGLPIMIDPADSDIVWNATLNRWEVTFDAAGFGGFIVSNERFKLLPVTLLSFNGRVTGNNMAELTWKTSDEINVSHYEVEFSANGRQFAAAGRVNARNQSSASSYSLNTPMNGKSVYFRLKMSDKDGNYTYSQVINLRVSGAYTMSVFPNPARDKVNIDLSGMEDPNAIRLLDLGGKVLQSLKAASGMNTIDLGKLPVGIYVVEITSMSGVTERAKVVKQ